MEVLVEVGSGMTEELRRFTTVDNHDTVKFGDFEKTLESLSVVEP